MGEGPESSFEISEFVSALERFKDRCERDGSEEELVGVLDLALRVSEGREEVAFAREHVRRTLVLSFADMRKLSRIAREIWEENYQEWYAISELMQAAGVASLGLGGRGAVSEQLAAAASQVGQIERARAAYADAFESLEVAARFSFGDEDHLRKTESSLRQGWNEIGERSEHSFELFDQVADDPAREWMDLIVWNSDRAGGEGLLAQVDAAQRLAVRFRHWSQDRGKTLAEIADQMRSLCASAAAGDAFLQTRYLATLGDALAEVGEWDAAARAFNDVRHPELGIGHPMGAHGLIQEAHCHFMLGDIETCRARLDSVDMSQLELLSDLVITVAAEVARYHSVARACRYWQGEDATPDTDEKIAQLLRRVGAIVSSSGEGNRTHYLRNLFFAVLIRDIEALKSVAR